jgi:glycosyltransferase involved in cell wall biosynthesis
MTEAIGTAARGQLRIAALFVSDWDHEFAAVAAGVVPSHRLFGMRELERRGHTVLHHTRPATARLARRVGWRLSQLLWLVRVQRDVDVVIATHEAAALPALLLRRLGVVRRPVIAMTVAALEATSRPGVAGAVQRAALRGADAVTIFSSSQRDDLSRRLRRPPQDLRPVPLGVDTEFFAPRSGARGGGLLSVGTNAGKDYPTLMAALRPGERCVVVTDAWNRARATPLAEGLDVSFRSDVPIAELRELYADADVMVLPLREAEMSSGQTVLLENLAMGTPVVISDVSGVADYLDPQVTKVVQAGHPLLLRQALLDTSWRERAQGGPDLVARRFTVEHLASAVESIAHELVADEA